LTNCGDPSTTAAPKSQHEKRGKREIFWVSRKPKLLPYLPLLVLGLGTTVAWFVRGHSGW
jgi:hypothetical protein